MRHFNIIAIKLLRGRGTAVWGDYRGQMSRERRKRMSYYDVCSLCTAYNLTAESLTTCGTRYNKGSAKNYKLNVTIRYDTADLRVLKS